MLGGFCVGLVPDLGWVRINPIGQGLLCFFLLINFFLKKLIICFCFVDNNFILKRINIDFRATIKTAKLKL